MTSRLIDDPSVLWAEQQQISVREKRDFLSSKEFPSRSEAGPKSRFIRALLPKARNPFAFGFDTAKNNMLYRYNDELWPHQWYIHNPGLSKWDHGITKVSSLADNFVLIIFCFVNLGLGNGLHRERSRGQCAR